ncbi:hypothetical protein HDV02_006146 [Globomyces sp. JEL0801]|nr:hypothetical protein HDV02_006146 [Globomyces sp. JEL0801]
MLRIIGKLNKRFIQTIADPAGLSPQLFYNDVRSSPYCPASTIHDLKVLQIKMDKRVDVASESRIALPRSSRGPSQLFMLFKE